MSRTIVRPPVAQDSDHQAPTLGVETAAVAAGKVRDAIAVIVSGIAGLVGIPVYLRQRGRMTVPTRV